jgi:hypothetical protein
MSLIWTQATLEPKRKFKYLINFGDPQGLLGDFTFLAQTCDRPGVKVGVSEHKYFDKTYHHPGRVTWDPNPLSIKVVDIQKNGVKSLTDTNETLLAAFADSGLSGIILPNGSVRTIGKESAVNALGSVTIRVLNASLTADGVARNDANGVAVVGATIDSGVAEEWVLKNAWLESFKPDALDYGSEDILTVTMTVRYDWAEFRSGETVRASGPAINKFS